MSTQSPDGIYFNVETSRILEILSSEIYDSPYALMRENMQNAYDAVLMRSKYKNIPLEELQINISMQNNRLTITDDGIGMSEDVLRNNFWKAGSSGKRTELAKSSGVVGTFGIGAMANFGVCTSLRVETRYVDSDETLISYAERDKLSIAEECISLERTKDDRSSGTILIAEFDPGNNINEAAALSYLEPYVKYIPIPVTFNDKIISQQSFFDVLSTNNDDYQTIGDHKIEKSIYSCTLKTLINKTGAVTAKIYDISVSGVPVNGEALLTQQGGQLMGLRNYFGLAPIPSGGHYQFGGYVNLSILHPTAGREALSRESIQHVNSLINMIEEQVSCDLATTTAANVNVPFLNYINSHSRFDLAGNITIRLLPEDREIPLSQVSDIAQTKTTLYFTGRDQQVIETFSSDSSYLLHVTQANPKRNIQTNYLASKTSINPVPDQATIIKEYSPSDISYEEGSLLIKIAATLSDDYLLPDVDISYADISHGVSFLVNKEGDTVKIKIAKGNPIIIPVLETYRTAYEVFGGFVKDFVRNHIYSKVAQYVPSSTKEGADALQRILKKNKELYRYEDSELGDIRSILDDYFSGELSFNEVLKTAKSKARPQAQHVQKNNVGQVEELIPDVISSPNVADPDGAIEVNEYSPMPSILRQDLVVNKKVLTAGEKHPQLNNFKMFLGMTDRLFKREKDFFLRPHTTKLIWAGHRVVYIFTEPSGNLSLYYDIELKEPLDETNASGGMFPTTTLITKNRIFVPIPEQLEPAFYPVDGVKEFFVRFDTL